MTKQAVGGKQQTENSFKNAESRQQWQVAGGRRQNAKAYRNMNYVTQSLKAL
jgi:hypothetical protein